MTQPSMEWEDLKERLEAKLPILDIMIENAPDRGTSLRLYGKKQGIELAIDLMRGYYD